MPQISPAATGSTQYDITDSKALIADLNLTVGAVPATVALQYPTATAGVQATLVRGSVTLDLLPGPINDTTTFIDRQVQTFVNTTGADTRLDIVIGATTGAATEAWGLRVSGLAGAACRLEQPENDPTALTVIRLMCDPVAGFSSSPSGTVGEQTSVTLTAVPPNPGGTTVVGTPLPTTTYRWTHSSPIAIGAFPTTGPSQTLPFTTPGVYAPTPLNITEQVWYGDPSAVGFLNNASAPQTLTVQPRPQYLMLLLDRSGSMGGSRWDHARTAARVLANMFVGLRQGVSPDDRVGVMVFEDGTCTWHGPPIDPQIARVFLDAPAAVDVCGSAFGSVGACTPIGDALYRGMQELNGLGTAGNPNCTIVLLTDGYENSGTIRVSPDTPGSAPLFEDRRSDFPDVNSRLTLYTIGVGTEVQENVLDRLAIESGARGGVFRIVTDLSELKDALAQMVSFSQEAQAIVAYPGAPPVADPDPSAPSPARYFHLDPRINRLLVAVEWSNAADTLELAKREKDPTTGTFKNAFVAVGAAVKQCPTHGFVAIDVAQLYGGNPDDVPETEWRLVHRSGGAPQPITDADLLVFVDLFAKAELVFDRDHYGTGDPIRLTCRLRAGPDPITSAKVTVELARPGEGLGTFLVNNSQRYKPSQPAGPDPAHPKQLMLQQLLRANDMSALPVDHPAVIFADGTAELFDDGAHGDGAAGDGDYSNLFVDTTKEGTYTWRIFVDGILPDGSTFNRLLVVSRWVGVTVDAGSSPVTWTSVPGPAGQLAAEVSVTPRDLRGEYLGPFRASDVEFKSTAGTFAGDVESHYDGSYTQTLIYRKGETPSVTVIVQDRPFRPIPVGGKGCLGGWWKIGRKKRQPPAVDPQYPRGPDSPPTRGR